MGSSYSSSKIVRVKLSNMQFFFHDTATTEIYTLSLHDALPIFEGHLRRKPRMGPGRRRRRLPVLHLRGRPLDGLRDQRLEDRKSTRLNSSHGYISYAVFCLKKKIKIRSSDSACTTVRCYPSTLQ